MRIDPTLSVHNNNVTLTNTHDFIRHRSHSGGTGWRRRFAAALLIALAAVASGVPAFAQSPALTAQFENAPASHDGSSVFRVELRFSEAVDLSFSAFENGLLSITGGTLENQRRLGSLKPHGWEIDVRPGGNGEVTITLPVSEEACNRESVVCTTDGRPLSAPASVTVRGRTPWVTGSTSFTAAENQEIPTAVATLTASDIKTPNGPFTWLIPAGAAGGAAGGRFTLSSTGVLAFVSAKDFENPDDADTKGSYEVTVEVSDGALKATADLTVTLTDVDEAPYADAGPSRFLTDLTGSGKTVYLDGTGYDPEDRTNVSFAWMQTGGTGGTLTDEYTERATFTVPAAATEGTTYTFTFRVIDSTGKYSEDTVKVKFIGQVSGQRPQEPMITSATSFMAAENQTVVATLTATDADTPLADLVWSIAAGINGGADGSRFTLSAAGDLAFASTKDFENPDNADSDGIYEVTVQVSDGDYAAFRDLTVTLTNVNEAPTANAGPNQFAVQPGATVTLSGSGSDPDAGDTLSYAWTKTGGTGGTLANANAATATFTAPSDLSQTSALTFTLRVTDEGGLNHEDTVTLTVVSQPPVITSATSFEAAENQTAVAALTATDAVTPDANLTWSIPADAAGGADRGKFTLSSVGVLAFESTQDFENPDDADTDGIYAVTVEVSDGDLTNTADLTVTLTNVNEAPIANAGADQTGVLPSTVVTLSGQGSDPDAGDTLRYAWTQTGSQAGTLTNADAATATFAPPAVTAATTLTFTLRVTDEGGLNHEDTVTVTVNPLLTAQFENAPVNHDRFNSFSVVLRFSEDVELNSNAFSNGLLTITNGMLLFHGQLTEGSSIAWRFDVKPSTERKNVIITLPANRACEPDAAPCTSDGRRLSAEASVTVTSWTPPVITSAASLTAAENQTAVATLTATDDETPPADLTWILQAPGSSGAADEDKFTLSDDGVLAFQFAQDFEYPDDANADGRYEVKIHIRDEDHQLTTNPDIAQKRRQGPCNSI